MNQISKYPIDFYELNQGDIIDTTTIEQILGITFHENYEDAMLGAMSLADTIKRKLKYIHGRTIDVKVRKKQIHILTDDQFAIEVPDRIEKKIKHIAKTLNEARGIDQNLVKKDEDKRRLNDSIMVGVAVLQSARKEKKIIKNNMHNGKMIECG